MPALIRRLAMTAERLTQVGDSLRPRSTTRRREAAPVDLNDVVAATLGVLAGPPGASAP